MKKFLFAIVAGLISALAVTTGSYAQTHDEIASTGSGKNYYKMSNSGISDNSNAANVNLVNAKALKNFRKLYNANNEKWFLQADCIVACYELDNISHSIYFDKKGNWAGSLKNYQEDKMPKDIRKMIKQEYYDYKILLVQEISTFPSPSTPAYIVTMQGDKDVKLIRILDDKMDVYKEFKRS